MRLFYPSFSLKTLYSGAKLGTLFRGKISNMEWVLRIKIQLLIHKILRNKVITFLSFIFLITAIIFIKLHPNSVWYYFAAGFFICRMMELIFQKTDLKYQIDNTINQLKSIKKGLTQ